MADVRVKNNQSGEIQEMSEVSFQMLRHEWTLLGTEPGKRPVIEEWAGAEQGRKDAVNLNNLLAEKVLATVTHSDPIKSTSGLTRKQLEAKYESLFMEKPHHRMKDETIIEKIKEQSKMMVDTSTGD